MFDRDDKGDLAAPLSDADLELLRKLSASGVRFMLVGQSAAVIQGARGATEDIDIWFEDVDDPRIPAIVREAGGVWVSGAFGMRPPQLGGGKISAFFDVVLSCDGLGPFAEEYENAVFLELPNTHIKLLPLERILHSKRAAGRPKDLAQIPALEVALKVKSASKKPR